MDAACLVWRMPAIKTGFRCLRKIDVEQKISCLKSHVSGLRKRQPFTAGTGLSAKFGNPKSFSLAGLAVATSGPPRQPAAQ